MASSCIPPSFHVHSGTTNRTMTYITPHDTCHTSKAIRRLWQWANSGKCTQRPPQTRKRKWTNSGRWTNRPSDPTTSTN
eukprot:scaffold110886_cov17-Tisochrysis_lutea.AAC.1